MATEWQHGSISARYASEHSPYTVSIATALAAVSAIAAATAAIAAWRNVLLAHRPYLFAQFAGGSAETLYLSLHNDGPGAALDIQVRVKKPDESWAPEPTPQIHTLRAGMGFPSQGSGAISVRLPEPAMVHDHTRRQGLRFVVRYRGIGGDWWESITEPDRPGVVQRRLRSRQWQRWLAPADW